MKEFAADGMHEFKLPGVKEMSFKPVPFSIERISDNRVAQMLQMLSLIHILPRPSPRSWSLATQCVGSLVGDSSG